MSHETKPLQPRLTQSRKRWLAGVCGGIAEFLGWTPRAVRFLWVTVTLLTAVVPGVVAYSLLAVAFPPPPPDGPAFDINRLRKQ